MHGSDCIFLVTFLKSPQHHGIVCSQEYLARFSWHLLQPIAVPLVLIVASCCNLGGGFKHCSFSPCGMIQFDWISFLNWIGWNHQQGIYWIDSWTKWPGHALEWSEKCHQNTDVHTLVQFCTTDTGWCFQIFYISSPTWGNISILTSMFFKWVVQPPTSYTFHNNKASIWKAKLLNCWTHIMDNKVPGTCSSPHGVGVFQTLGR